MRPDVDSATDRVASIRARLSERGHEVPLQEREDALSEGYARALEGDAWLAHAEQRLHELIDDVSMPIRGRDLRVLVKEHSEVQHSVIALRRELAGLRHEHDRLLDRSQLRIS